MTVLAQTLCDDTRVISGLRNNPLLSDTQIVELLNDAFGAARDKFVVALEHWFRATVNFTLAGNVSGSNTFDLTTIPDFQMDQGLNWLPGGNAPPITVPRLGSFAERNTISGGLGWLTGQQRQYFTNGDLLFVDPFSNSAGTYQLIYTPQGVPMALPVTVALPNAGSGNMATVAGAFLINLGTPANIFLPTDVGGTVTVTGTASNNGTHVITVVQGPNAVVWTGIVNEAFPDIATATLVRQPAGTRPDLPAVLTPLALFLKVHASIAIQTSRKQFEAAARLETKLQAESIRLLALAKKRSEGPRQAPITQRRRRWGTSYLGN